MNTDEWITVHTTIQAKLWQGMKSITDDSYQLSDVFKESF